MQSTTTPGQTQRLVSSYLSPYQINTKHRQTALFNFNWVNVAKRQTARKPTPTLAPRHFTP
jgi:hypothetical protein